MINKDPNHVHTYDALGNMTCCTLEEKVTTRAEEHDHDHDHDQPSKTQDQIRLFGPAITSLVLLTTALVIDNFFSIAVFSGSLRVFWYLLAYLPVAIPVIRDAARAIGKGEIFTEFLLMGIATIGAFAIGDYAEGVAVMLFYAVGELFQTLAVRKAKSDIKNLLDQRPDTATVVDGQRTEIIAAEAVKIGSIIQVKPGEKIGLDGVLLTDLASFNTAALTGESMPATKTRGDIVLAGMINLNGLTQIQVTAAYTDSKLSQILDLVQNASAKKPKTELFIRKFARYYTPAVVALAAVICLVPYFVAEEYVFRDWFYRALVFLVISCPCALVISIPLGYFGGIGAASKNGILFKGGNFIDLLAGIQNVVMDKTGTLTKGAFKVMHVRIESNADEAAVLRWVNALSSKSTHPIAAAIHAYAGPVDPSVKLDQVEELPGLGMKALTGGHEIMFGNAGLMDKFGIISKADVSPTAHTAVMVSVDKKFAGYLTLADEIKEDAPAAIQALQGLGIRTVMLSGDKKEVVEFVAGRLGIDSALGELLPTDKVDQVAGLKANGESVAFAGDGINDAPVIALADVGIAMGGLGSDATIETADVVIQDDRPSRIPLAIKISRMTKNIVWQNIGLAFGVKISVLILGAGGLATLWEAVFADVGVALLAILNAVRIQRMDFRD